MTLEQQEIDYAWYELEQAIRAVMRGFNIELLHYFATRTTGNPVLGNLAMEIIEER